VFTPLGAPVRGQVSATARETFGCVALSAPSDGSSLAVTLAHEVQHAKLTALMDLFPLIWPGTDVRGYAPWQPEPRPLDALLHGAYAYVGVTRFWRRQRQLERHPSAALHAHTEFARWRVAARDVTVSLLGSGRLMPHGRLLAMGMLRSLNQWCRDDVPADALLAAARTAKRHKDQWLRRHGPLL
jgi:HEXXH motif-containing protein